MVAVACALHVEAIASRMKPCFLNVSRVDEMHERGKIQIIPVMMTVLMALTIAAQEFFAIFRK